MKACCTAALWIAVSTPALAQALEVSQASGPAADVSAVQNALSGYQAAIRAKDENALLALYLDPQVQIISVMSARTYTFVSAHNPGQTIPRYQRYTAKTSVPMEIKTGADIISDLHIDTDGSVAHASWAYAMANGSGHGRINESLIRTNAGWKITDVQFSINLANAEKK